MSAWCSYRSAKNERSTKRHALISKTDSIKSGAQKWYPSGLSKFFGWSLIQGLVWSQVAKFEEMAGKSSFYSSPPKLKILSKI